MPVFPARVKGKSKRFEFQIVSIAPCFTLILVTPVVFPLSCSRPHRLGLRRSRSLRKMSSPRNSRRSRQAPTLAPWLAQHFSSPVSGHSGLAIRPSRSSRDRIRDTIAKKERAGIASSMVTRPRREPRPSDGTSYRLFDPSGAILRCFSCHSTGPLTLAADDAILPHELGVALRSLSWSRGRARPGSRAIPSGQPAATARRTGSTIFAAPATACPWAPTKPSIFATPGTSATNLRRWPPAPASSRARAS